MSLRSPRRFWPRIYCRVFSEMEKAATTAAESNWKAPTLTCGHLVAALCRTTDFRSEDHSATMQSGKAELQKRNQVSRNEKLVTILRPMRAEKSQTICRGKDTGAWLSVLPSTLNGTALLAQEFQADALSMRHAETPHNFLDKCNGCDAHFSLQHALGCKKGGLVIFRRNEIRDKVVNLATPPWQPVRDEPLIQGCANENVKTSPSKTTNHQNVDKEAATGEDERGDLLSRGFWTAGTNCILVVCVTAAVCATHFLCLRGSRVPAHNVSTRFSCNGKTELVQPCMNGPKHLPLPPSLLLSHEDTGI
jgi:hypothetical protein